MVYEHSMSKFIEKNKENVHLEDYIQGFYRKLRLFGQKYDNQQFEDLLTELYMKETEIYNEWINIFNKVPYYFIRSNTVLSTNLVSSDNPNLLLAAYEMEKKKRSIISRIIPVRVTVTSVKESKEKLLLQLQKLSLLMYSEEEDNILRKAQEQFAEEFSEYDNDPYLSDFYNNIIDGFEKELLTRINNEIKKIDGVNEKIAGDEHSGTIVNDIYFHQKCHTKNKFFKQTFK